MKGRENHNQRASYTSEWIGPEKNRRRRPIEPATLAKGTVTVPDLRSY